MKYLFDFFEWFFPAIWAFFKLPFPFMDMTIGQFGIGCSLIVFSFTLLGMMLSVRIGGSPRSKSDRGAKSGSGSKSFSGSDLYGGYYDY